MKIFFAGCLRLHFLLIINNSQVYHVHELWHSTKKNLWKKSKKKSTYYSTQFWKLSITLPNFFTVQLPWTELGSRSFWNFRYNQKTPTTLSFESLIRACVEAHVTNRVFYSSFLQFIKNHILYMNNFHRSTFDTQRVLFISKVRSLQTQSLLCAHKSPFLFVFRSIMYLVIELYY